MLKKTFLLVIIFATCSIYKVSAHYGLLTGCYSSGTNYIYFTESGTYSGMRNFNWDQGGSQGERVLLANTFCPTATTTNCRINGNGTGAVTGKLYTFYYYGCPIDDYIPLLLAGIGCFGFFVLRKNNLNTFFYS